MTLTLMFFCHLRQSGFCSRCLLYR